MESSNSKNTSTYYFDTEDNSCTTDLDKDAHSCTSPFSEQETSYGASFAREETETSETIPTEDRLHVFATKAAPAATDGGWAWVVLGCSFLLTGLSLGVDLAFGILFGEVLSEMRVSSTGVAWILNTHVFLWHTSSIFLGSLSHHFGWRRVGFVGSLASSIGFMLMTFATEPVHIFLCYSVLIGICGGASTGVCFLAVASYFDKYRGTAAAIMMTGVSVGQIYLPPLLGELQDKYGFQGATLIFGAIFSHCCIATLSYRPVQKHSGYEEKDVWSDGAKNIIEITPSSQQYSTDSNKIESNSWKARLSQNTVIQVLQTTLVNLRELRQLRLVVVTLSYTLLTVVVINFLAQLPFAMQASGHSRHEVAWNMSVSAIANTCTRVFVSCTSDRRWFSRKLSYTIGSSLVCASTFGVALVLHDLQWLTIVLVFWGVGVGLVVSVFYALLTDVCGAELYVAGITCKGLLLAAVSLCIAPFFGVIRDMSSYSWSLSTIGIMQLFATLLWTLLPLAVTHDVTKYKSSL